MFLCLQVLWYNILLKVNGSSKLLQSPKVDVETAVKSLERIKSYFVECRTQAGLDKIIADGEKLAQDLEVEPNFPLVNQVRRRQKRAQFEYKQPDEVINDPKDIFRVNCFYKALDQTIASIDERFEQPTEHSNYFSVLYDLKKNERIG